MQKLNNWLESKYNNSCYIRPYHSQYTIDQYYQKNDIDIKKDDIWSRQLIESLDSTRSRDIYRDNPELLRKKVYSDHILLNPDTNRYHTNMLFRQLIDYTLNNDLTDLFNIEMKNAFYKFCFEMS